MDIKKFCKTILDFTEKATNSAPEVDIFFTINHGEDYFLPTNVNCSKMFDDDSGETPFIVVNIT